MNLFWLRLTKKVRPMLVWCLLFSLLYIILLLFVFGYSRKILSSNEQTVSCVWVIDARMTSKKYLNSIVYVYSGSKHVLLHGLFECQCVYAWYVCMCEHVLKRVKTSAYQSTSVHCITPINNVHSLKYSWAKEFCLSNRFNGTMHAHVVTQFNIIDWCQYVKIIPSSNSLFFGFSSHSHISILSNIYEYMSCGKYDCTSQRSHSQIRHMYSSIYSENSSADNRRDIVFIHTI